MTIEYNVPFFANTPDDTRCFQAALRMVLKYYQPERDFTWEELDRITLKQDGHGTWPATGLAWLRDEGYEVQDIEPFDYERFIQEGGDYLVDTFGHEVGDAMIADSDIDEERRRTKDFLTKVAVEKRLPEILEIDQYLGRGYLIICNVNSKALNNKPGYAGHFVVITGHDQSSLRLHDPGLPAQENRIVNRAQFEAAWASPNDNARNLMAVKLASSSKAIVGPK